MDARQDRDDLTRQLLEWEEEGGLIPGLNHSTWEGKNSERGRLKGPRGINEREVLPRAA